MNRDAWIDREVSKNRARIRDLELRNEKLLAERSTPPDAEDAALADEMRAAHDLATADPAAKGYRAFVLHKALEAGWTKYRISQVLNVSRGMVYHYLDPDYQKKLNAKRRNLDWN